MLPKALNHVAWLMCPCAVLVASVVRLSRFMRVYSCPYLAFALTNWTFAHTLGLHWLISSKTIRNLLKSMRNRSHISRTFRSLHRRLLGLKSMFPKAFNASDAFTRCLERSQMASNAPKSSQLCGLAQLSLCHVVCFCRPPLVFYACVCVLVLLYSLLWPIGPLHKP